MEAETRVIGLPTARVLRSMRALVAPATAVVYLAAWTSAEIGRWQGGSPIATVALLAAAVGVAVWMPRTAMGLGLAVAVLQEVGLTAPLTATTWPATAAIAIIALFVGAFGRGSTRVVVPGFVAAAAVLFALGVAVPTFAKPFAWGAWTGDRASPEHDALVLGLAGFALGIGAWLLGLAIAALLDRLAIDVATTTERLERTDLELRLAEDRARISRDVHDSLAHSLAVIVSQAQGAAALAAARPEVAPEALATVGEVARGALTDVRMLVERIQGDVAGAAPAPLAEGVPDLVERMRGLGMTVDLRVSGRTLALSDAQQVAVYRIVQESLTNALKHAGPDARVTVGIEAASRGVSLNVTSEGEDPLVARGDPGAGIDGMKERARLAGGWLRAAPTGRDGRGGFVVTAFVPVGGRGAVHV